jgi:hypothetical protein
LLAFFASLSPLEGLPPLWSSLRFSLFKVMADITKTVREMKVLALRTELKNRGLSPSGLKSSLVRRLLKALKAEGYEVQDLGEEEEVVGVDHGEEETASHVGKWRRYMISKRFRGVRHATVRSIHVAERKEIWLVGDTTDSIVSYAQGSTWSAQPLANQLVCKYCIHCACFLHPSQGLAANEHKKTIIFVLKNIIRRTS